MMKFHGDISIHTRVQLRPCWLIAEDPGMKTAQVVKGYLHSEPEDGIQVVSVGLNVYTILVDHIYRSIGDAQKRLVEVCADGDLSGLYGTGIYPVSIVKDLSQTEQERFASWTQAHLVSCSPDRRDAGRWSIRIVGTSLGNGVDVLCNCCDIRYEVTDYDCW